MATVYKREGSPFYQANITVGGVRRRISTQERNRNAAQKKADAIEREENERLEKAKGMLFSDAAARFFKVKENKLKPRTIEFYKTSFRNVYSILGDFSITDLSHKDITYYVNERMKDIGSVAVRSDLAFLSTLLSSAKHWEPDLTTNVVKTYDKGGLPVAKERNVWLKPVEVQKLIDACTQPYQKLFILLAVGTGMRSSEMRLLRWDEIDFRNREIVLDNLGDSRTKTGQSRIIPLGDLLFDTLKDTHEGSRSEWVFVNPETGNPFTTFKTFWRGVNERSGLKTVRIHDLRHTYASWAKQSGVDEVTIMDIMGHKTRSMVKRYSHTSRESLHRAVEKMGNVTNAVTEPTNLRMSRREVRRKKE